MATGRGINPKSVFTRTNPADAAQRIPALVADGQLGYDVRTRDILGIKIENDTNQVTAWRLLGFTFEDDALAEPVELLASANVAAGANDHDKVELAGIACVQVEVDPAAAATGGLTVVFGTDVKG
jgi:hypothetical protein